MTRSLALAAAVVALVASCNASTATSMPSTLQPSTTSERSPSTSASRPPAPTPTQAPTPSPEPTPSPTPNPRVEAIKEIAGSIIAKSPVSASIKQVKASVAAAYATAPGAEQTIARSAVTENITMCGDSSSGYRNAERLMFCDSSLIELIEAYGATIEPQFSNAATQLWGYMVTRSGLRSVREATIPYLKIVFAAELGVRPTYISGTVTDSQGSPLEGVQVQASYGGGGFVTAVTRADGVYTINGLMPNTYYLSFSRDGYSTVLCGASGATTRYSKQKPIVVDSLGVDGVDIALPAGTTVAGKVTDKHGSAYPGVRVKAYLVANDAESQAWIVTGADGTYTLHVVPGTYQLTFEPPGSDGFVLTASGPKPWGSTTTPRNVKVGTSAVRLNVKLPASR